MKTKKQQELIEDYLSGLTPELETVYRELISHLSELGYEPKKQRSAIVFNCPQHKKQIAKIGFSCSFYFVLFLDGGAASASQTEPSWPSHLDRWPTSWATAPRKSPRCTMSRKTRLAFRE